MTTNYNEIKEKNVKHALPMLEKSIEMSLVSGYSDRAHFVYELLQNAEDALRRRPSEPDGFSRDVKFELNQEELVFRHYGSPFTKEDVRGICNVWEGTKNEDLMAIGKHGVGFKSVYAYTSRPEVHSGDEHFDIEGFIQPSEIPPRIKPTDETLFSFPFNHRDVSKEDAYKQIAVRLKELGLKTLLFLQNIESISWETDSGERGRYRREPKCISEDADRITLSGHVNGEAVSKEEWLVFRKAVEKDKKPAGFVELAFRIGRDGDSSQDRIRRVPESPLTVFFPTEIQTHLGFLMQGPYRTTPSRDNIRKDDPWNQYLVSTSAGFVGEVLEQLRAEDLMTTDALTALIVDPSKYEPESQSSMFRPVFEAVLMALKEERLIPRFGGGHVAAKNARLARTERLRSLVSPAQLQEFTGSAEAMAWITEEITRDRTPELHSFLVEHLEVEQIDTEDFVRDITDEFLARQSDDWIIKFYASLGEQRDLQKRPWLRKKQLIRLEDGSHVAPFRADEIPNAYLPADNDTDFPTVKRAICENEDALAFLSNLGLEKPDPVDDILQNVLPRYMEESEEAPPEYESDVQRIVAAYGTDSSSHKQKLIDHLSKSFWVQCRNASTGQVRLRQPAMTYFPTEKLETLFAGNSDIWFVDSSKTPLQKNEAQEVLKSCGSDQFLNRTSCPCNLSEKELGEIRRKAGLLDCTGSNINDYTVTGVAETLERIRTTSGEEQISLSLAIWQCSHEALDEHHREFFYGEYAWWFGKLHKTATFPSDFVRRLRKASWLLGRDGRLKRPSELGFSELSEEFKEGANPVLVDLLEFKPDEIRQLAEKMGIDEGILDALRDLPEETLRKVRKLLDLDGGNTITPPPPGGNGGGKGTRGPGTQGSNVTVGTPPEDGDEENGEGEKKRKEVEQAGVQHVVNHERTANRFPEIMPSLNPGYDVESRTEDGGEVERYIEVKSLSGNWKDSRGAMLTKTQFEKADELGARCWLYVVERALDEDFSIWRIPDPARQVSRFIYDDRWKALAE